MIRLAPNQARRRNNHPQSAFPCIPWYALVGLRILAILFLVPVDPTRVWSATGPEKPARLLVMPRPGVAQADLDRFHTRHRLKLLRSHLALGNLQVLELPRGISPAEAAQACAREGLAVFAEPDAKIRAHALPNDPKVQSGEQWHLHNRGLSGGRVGADIQAVRAWDSLRDASSIIVAVVDSGIHYTHEDLAANMWRNPGEIPGNGRDDDRNGLIDDVHGLNAAGDNGDPMDTNGHGTHVAGIIGAVGNNGKGGSGVAWKVQLMACRFLVEDGEGNISDAIRCLDYARSKGAQVINCSWGTTANSAALSAAVDRLRTAGIIVVVSAGNEEADNDQVGEYPANFPHDNLVVVAATTASDRLASFSNFGASRVDLGAPGMAIHSTWNSSDTAYTVLSGTSMSAPMVSGALALLRARFPSESPPQLIDRLISTSDSLPDLAGKSVSGGRLNLRRALEETLFADFSVSTLLGSPPLMVSFTNTSRGEATAIRWDFGDGASSTDTQPSHTFEFEGNFTVTLKVTGTNGVQSVKTRVIATLGNYTGTPKPFAWFDPGSAKPLILFDDDVSPAIRLPFPFRFYGKVYEEVFVGANGIMGFRSEGLEFRANTTLPTLAPPNAILCPYWDNLNPGLSGEVTTTTIGTAPDRRFVTTWSQVPLNLGGLPLTFQAILEEGTGNIVFQYLEVHPESFRAGGLGATVGVESESGEIGYRYSFNGAPRTLTNHQAILIQPRFSPGMRVTPAGSISVSGPPGGPFSPASASVQLENLGQTPLQWRARLSASWLSLLPVSGTLEAGARATLTLSIEDTAKELPAGNHLDIIEIFNESNGIGNARIPVTLSIQGQAGELVLSQDAEFSASGPAGGPFTPSSRVYTLSNKGDAPIQWKSTSTTTWITLSPNQGTLGPGESAALLSRLTPDAEDLPTGSHRAEIQVTNLSTGRGGGIRLVNLQVLPPAPPRLSLESDSFGLHLTILFRPQATVRIESSPDLTRWTSLQTGTTSGDGALQVDLPVQFQGNLFLRAIAQP